MRESSEQGRISLPIDRVNPAPSCVVEQSLMALSGTSRKFIYMLAIFWFNENE